MSSEAEVIHRRLHRIIERFRLTGELTWPDPEFCLADEHPLYWAEVQRAWDEAAEMPPEERELAALKLSIASLFYVRSVERADGAPAEPEEPVDLAALRRRAADAHPDRGGDAAEFQRLHERYRAARARAVGPLC